VSPTAPLRNPLREPRVILRRYALVAAAGAVFLAIAWHILALETDWARMGGPGEILETALFFLPDLAFFPQTVGPLLETLLIAFWGTLLAMLMAIPVAYLAARNITPLYPLTYGIGRLLIVLSRSTHEIIFALVYVSAVGLGPLPGILALASRSVGFVAKTTAEAVENVQRGPIEAIEATGAGPLKVFVFAIVPQIFPLFVGNVIFQLDLTIRRAAILGLVGGGGIGLRFAELMQTLQYEKAGTVVIGITGMVILGELVSNRIRNRII